MQILPQCSISIVITRASSGFFPMMLFFLQRDTAIKSVPATPRTPSQGKKLHSFTVDFFAAFDYSIFYCLGWKAPTMPTKRLGT